MMIAALLALAAGAIAGIFLAARHFLRKRLPASVALFHGLGGATGFALVLLTVVREPTYDPIRLVLYLLIATVLLGAINLTFHLRKVRHRTSLILVHGLTAVTSATMLIRAIVLHPGAPEVQPPPAPAPTAADAAVVAALDAGMRDAAAVAALDAGAPDAAAAPAGAELAKKPAPEGFVVDESVKQALSRSITFDTKSANVSFESLNDIAEIAKALSSHPEIGLVQVQGHADERGSEARNIALTRARAAAVVEALVAKGIARTRLHSAGYGSRCPEDTSCQTSDAPESCHTPESWERDRRVAFVVLLVGKAPFSGEVVCARGADLIPHADSRFHAKAQ